MRFSLWLLKNSQLLHNWITTPHPLKNQKLRCEVPETSCKPFIRPCDQFLFPFPGKLPGPRGRQVCTRVLSNKSPVKTAAKWAGAFVPPHKALKNCKQASIFVVVAHVLPPNPLVREEGKVSRDDSEIAGCRGLEKDFVYLC